MFKFYVNKESDTFVTKDSSNAIVATGRYRRGRHFDVSSVPEFDFDNAFCYEVETNCAVVTDDVSHTDGFTTEKVFNEENYAYFCDFIDYCYFSKEETDFGVHTVYDKKAKVFREPTVEEQSYCMKFEEIGRE